MADKRDDASLGERREALALRERWTGSITRANQITQRTLGWFPVRVWRHFLDHSGFLLSAGVSYQALFAIFAVIYVAFAGAGVWLGGSPAAVNGLIDMMNSYVHGIIGDGGLFTHDQVADIASGARGVLALTGAVAIVVAIWTAIGFVSFARHAVRNIFGLPPDRYNVVILKARDFVAAIVLALALAAGFTVGSAGTWALDLIFAAFDWDRRSGWYVAGIGVASTSVSFAVFAITLAGLLRFLTRTALTWRMIRPGALIGAAGITVLQLAAGYLLGYVPNNPLLATFAIFVGLLLWFQVIGVILLFAAAWIAVLARDEGVALRPPTIEERRAGEHAVLVAQARDRLQLARAARDAAPWWRARAADRTMRRAVDTFLRIEGSAPDRADAR